MGTSGAVYPAASLPHEAQAAGAAVIGIDPAPVDADVWLQGAAANVLPRLVDEAFGASRA